ncbi:hypothetical protein [Roseicitreum antarcticum]|uniref:Holin-X, holin superfamily III n=1 Tax=Roseicitreum antarcticum TaxID=564137 RepID=A0A1H2ZBX4_9RHOB|nr:hypothetical protein [Roseicitreum antarcticum]SDX14845.1 hypothetical protein SAMN04488238_105322 [Roseicitreum antarcticum]
MLEQLAAYRHAAGQAVQLTARRAAFYAVGSLMLLVCLAMFSAAGWLALADAFSPLVAWVSLGCGYLGIGILALLIGSGVPQPKMPPPPRQAQHAAAGTGDPQAFAAMPALFGAFMFGFSTYMKLRKSPPRP